MQFSKFAALFVGLALASCSKPVEPVTDPLPELLDRKWVLLRLGENVPFPGEVWEFDGFRNLSLTFSGQELAGYDGCNAFGGRYEATATALNIGQLAGSLRGCRPAVQRQAEAYTDALAGVATYQIKRDSLELQNAEGETTLWFTEADASYRLTLDLEADAPVNLDERSKIRVVVWGDDALIADEPPTTLVNEVLPLPSLDVNPSVTFEEEDLLALDLSTGPNARLGYFLSFDIDADGDGRVCVGDYRQDFDRTETRFYEKDDTGEQVQEMFIVEITDPNECRAF